MNDEIEDTLPDDIFDNFDVSTKCGEIFVAKGEFNYLCTYCGSTFINLQNFSQHLFENHQIFNFEPILNENYKNYRNNNYKNCDKTISKTTETLLNSPTDVDSTITLEKFIFNFDNQSTTSNLNNNNNNIQKIINYDEFIITSDDELIKDKKINDDKLKSQTNDDKIIIRSTIKPFKCEICNKGFCTNKNVKYHQEKCSLRTIPFPCHFCPRKFFTNDKCNRHEKSKHRNQLNPDIPNGFWQCQICLKILSNTCGRKKHLDGHFIKSSGRNFKQHCSCKLCGKELSSTASLKVHMRIHNDENCFKCSYCPAAFKFSTSLKTHELSHTGDRQFDCRYCSKKFLQKSHRQNHELLHAKEKKYECTECNMKFLRKDYLNSHIKNKHTVRKDENRPYQCKYCNSSFTAEKYLKNHQRLHENGIEYKCKYCERTSIVKGIIERHERTHLKLKEFFNCTLCPKKFESRNGLLNHQRNKHPNNLLIQLKCGKCEQLFNNELDLQQHIRKICNLTVKNYPCCLCTARFDNDHGLKVHRAVVHQQEKNLNDLNISSSICNKNDK